MLLQIVITGAKSVRGSAGDIAIDDTSLTAGKCATLPPKAIVPTMVMTSSTGAPTTATTG